ncbi:MAG: 50S ribosomal protein L22 [Candidatus Moraniibacteriota bacterium]
MKVVATLKNLRIAPRKSRLVVGSVIGMQVDVALVQLGKQTKRTSLPMLTLLRSAIANAENNFGLDRKTLFVKTAEVGEGAKLKRWKPKAFGRAGAIIKRSSKIFLVLENREEGIAVVEKSEKKEKAKKIVEKIQAVSSKILKEKKEEKKEEKVASKKAS